jgi:hypothetical protein
LLNANDKTKQITGDKEKCFHYYIPNQTNINEINPSLISYIQEKQTPTRQNSIACQKSISHEECPRYPHPWTNGTCTKPTCQKPPKERETTKKGNLG